VAVVNMTAGTLAITPVISASLQQPSGWPARPVGIAALIAWLLTVSIGAYMLRTYIARGGLRRQRVTGVGVPPQVVFGHAGVALTGLALWVSYLASGWDPLAWLGVVLVGTAISLGICMVTLWTPYPIRADPEAGQDTAFAAASHSDPPARPGVRLGTAAGESPAASAEHPDAFTVTDEMIARLLAEPIGANRRRLHLLPLIPACHGFAALATFLLAVMTAMSAR
jgi:hypothetical protein